MKYVTETSTRKPRRRGFPELIEWIGVLEVYQMEGPNGRNDTLFLNQIHGSSLASNVGRPGLLTHTGGITYAGRGRCETAVLQEPRKTKHGLVIYHLSLTSKVRYG